MKISSVQLGSIGSTYPASLGAPSSLNPANYDPADTNQDGFVSAVERRAYALKHPQAAAIRNADSTTISSFAYHDPRDGNEDGSVSPMEKANYARTHPSQASDSPFAHYEPEDTNRDGLVSPLEKSLYALKHPASVQGAAAGYTAQGTMASHEASSRHLFDVYA